MRDNKWYQNWNDGPKQQEIKSPHFGRTDSTKLPHDSLAMPQDGQQCRNNKQFKQPLRSCVSDQGRRNRPDIYRRNPESLLYMRYLFYQIWNPGNVQNDN